LRGRLAGERTRSSYLRGEGGLSNKRRGNEERKVRVKALKTIPNISREKGREIKRMEKILVWSDERKRKRERDGEGFSLVGGERNRERGRTI